MEGIDFGPSAKTFISGDAGTVFGEWSEINEAIKNMEGKFTDYVVENDRRNSAIPLVDMKNIKARIEPGAIIRDQVEIGDNAVIMMGATINIGAVIGEGTMIDMNAVLGGRATSREKLSCRCRSSNSWCYRTTIGKTSYIGGRCMIGANVVVLEGVTIGQGSVVVAGAVVTQDIPSYSVAAGIPAKGLKQINEKTKSKTEIIHELRQL